MFVTMKATRGNSSPLCHSTLATTRRAMQPQQLDTQIVEYVLDNLDLRHDVGGPEAPVSVAVRLHDHRQPLRRAVDLAPA